MSGLTATERDILKRTWSIFETDVAGNGADIFTR